MSSFDDRDSNWRFERSGHVNFSSRSLMSFSAPFRNARCGHPRPGGPSVRIPFSFHFPGAHLSADCPSHFSWPSERAGCSASISATNFQRSCTREATESRSRGLSPTRASMSKVDPPIRRNEGHESHEARLAACSESSEVRLTPRLQLRRDLCNRLGSP